MMPKNKGELSTQKEIEETLEKIEERLIAKLEKLNSYIQGNGNSKNLKKRSQRCLDRVKKK